MKRHATLLEFAIAASAAVVPVLLVVLLIVAWLRPQEAATRVTRDADHHVSVRQVAALKTFERAIVRRDKVSSPAPTVEALLAGVPACRAEWEGQRGTMTRVRRWLSRNNDAPQSPAARIAAQLAQLDQSLAAFSTAANRRVTDAVGFDTARWTEAVSALVRTPVESSEYPDRKFVVQCADVASAVSILTRGNARMLNVLAWRGSEVPRTIAQWRPDQFVEISARHIARANPWAGIPGCVYMGGYALAADGATMPTHFVAESRGVAERVCPQASMRGNADNDGNIVVPAAIIGEPAPDMPADDERWKVPPSLSTMLASLAPLHRPGGALFRQYAGSDGNRVRVNASPLEVGYSIDITIEPAVQALAQKVAACYTGRQDVCQALGVKRKEDERAPIGHRLLEHAMVRMAAVAVIDVGSGRIEALAGAMSPCTREEYDGPGRSPNCDKRMPYPIRYRPDALLNAAAYHDAMPASVIKPIMATAFLSDPQVGPRWLAAERAEMQRTPWPTRDSLRGQLMRSDSARFLDRMFCADLKFARCDRPWEVQAAAFAFGWNADCTQPREDCGKRDLLFGRAATEGGLATIVPFGRLMVEPSSERPGTPMRVRRAVALDTAKVVACAAGPDGRRGSKDDWEKCRGRIVVDVVAEGWGQGNARSSALGVAAMMASLAAAANGEDAHAPHLVHAVRGAGFADGSTIKLSAPDALAPNALLSHDAAEVILSGLSYSHRAGTARGACEQVFDARTCRDIDWLAGKTGTPTFPNDDVSLDELARLCAGGAPRSRSEFATCGALRPYKWYVAAYRTDPADTRWSKVIGVLTERNWLADSGRIHGAGDHGPNPAAEIAMQIAGRHVGVLK
jgi:hypothetical protein